MDLNRCARRLRTMKRDSENNLERILRVRSSIVESSSVRKPTTGILEKCEAILLRLYSLSEA